MSPRTQPMAPIRPAITVEQLTVGYGDHVVMEDLSFKVDQGAIFFIMGGSGSGKSTLLRALIGLDRPMTGHVLFGEEDFWSQDERQRDDTLRRHGVLYQSAALFSSMTLAENVGLPLTQFTDLRRSEIAEVVSLKLALVGLSGFENFYPRELSGGMQKRAGLARAMALDPEILFLDEPSAGLDPLSSRRLDELILELRNGLGTTIVIVSHELSSILSIGDSSIFLDASAHTLSACGPPKELLARPPHDRVYEFLTRGEAHG